MRLSRRYRDTNRDTSAISFRALGALSMLALACGRTSLDSWTDGEHDSNAAGGAPANAGGTPNEGPDFDFTPVLDQATAYQVHPSHSGSQESVAVTPPLVELWSQRFEASVSYPVMADERVFVSLNPVDWHDGSVVRAFDAASGAALWTSESLRPDSGISPVHLAYDRAVVFAANVSGDVLALDAVTGGTRWRARLKDVYAFGTLPLAAGGALFVGAKISDFYRLFVLDERDGRLVYELDLPTGGDPTLGAGKIYTTGDCNETFALDPATGATLWDSADHCSAGDATKTMFHDGLLWVPAADGGVRVVDSASGTAQGTLDDPSPFFLLSAAGDQVVLPSVRESSALRVFGATSGAFRWQVALPARPILPSLATPDTVYVLAADDAPPGSSDKFLYGVDLGTRQLAWRSSEPAAPADDWDRTGAEPVQAMAASGGRIVVAYGRSLSAFAEMH